jgi:pre-mRNA 3'-end-processing factor FIP1
MDMDEDDDFYAPEEAEVQTTVASSAPSAPTASETQTGHQNDELEEGEEEDEGGDMDEDEDDSVIHSYLFLAVARIYAYSQPGYRDRH